MKKCNTNVTQEIKKKVIYQVEPTLGAIRSADVINKTTYVPVK